MKQSISGFIALILMLSGCAVTPDAPITQPNNQSNNKNNPATKTTPDAVKSETKAVNPDKIQGNEASPEAAINHHVSSQEYKLEGSIYFDFDRSLIRPEYLPLLESNAIYLNQNPQASVILTGNADERGSREYNLAIGQHRAAAVKKILNLHGVKDQQIETISNGEEIPVCSDNNEECHAKNRRTDLRYMAP